MHLSLQKQTVFQRVPCRDAVSTKPSGAVFSVWKEDNRDRIAVLTCSLVEANFRSKWMFRQTSSSPGQLLSMVHTRLGFGQSNRERFMI
ncbi:hypothetical protein AMECASPLE_029693 [Ameca splendens]|uniref:Uncharacterized protein n=1 Tax=Ameca splendens TaxID=208324 RepID=A0ABV0Z3P4_9TELE